MGVIFVWKLEGVQSRPAAPPHWKKPVEVVQATGKDALCTPFFRCMSGKASWGEALGTTLCSLEGLYPRASLGVAGDPQEEMDEIDAGLGELMNIFFSLTGVHKENLKISK